MVEKQSEAFHTFLWHFFPSLKQNFIAYRSSKMSSRPDCIFEIHQLWQTGFSRVYSNCCRSCSFEPEIIKIGQWSHKMYSNKLLNFQGSTTILKTSTKKSGNLLNTPRICMCVFEFLVSHKADVIFWVKRFQKTIFRGFHKRDPPLTLHVTRPKLLGDSFFLLNIWFPGQNFVIFLFDHLSSKHIKQIEFLSDNLRPY